MHRVKNKSVCAGGMPSVLSITPIAFTFLCMFLAVQPFTRSCAFALTYPFSLSLIHPVQPLKTLGNK